MTHQVGKQEAVGPRHHVAGGFAGSVRDERVETGRSGADGVRPDRDVSSIAILLDGASGPVRVVLVGQIDAVEVVTLRTTVAMVKVVDRPVVVDCTDLTFMDSTGVAFLARLVTSVAPHRVAVFRPPARLARVLEITRLDSVLDVVDAAHAADAAEVIA